MKNELMIFEGNNVKVIINEKGEPLFEIYSTGMALGYIKQNTINGKTYYQCRKDRVDKTIESAEIKPLVQDGLKYFTEEQLYDFMLECKTEKCKPFKKWVTHEVLPQIRKTGGYKLVDRKQELQLKLFSNDPLEVVEAHKELVAMETAPLIAKIEEDKPKVTFADRVLKSKDNILVRQVAKIASDEGFTIGERKLYNKLREWNYICKNSTEPTQYSMDRGYFVVKLGTIDTPYGIKETRTTLVTPKGTVRIVERLLKENGIN